MTAKKAKKAPEFPTWARGAARHKHWCASCCKQTKQALVKMVRVSVRDRVLLRCPCGATKAICRPVHPYSDSYLMVVSPTGLQFSNPWVVKFYPWSVIVQVTADEMSDRTLVTVDLVPGDPTTFAIDPPLCSVVDWLAEGVGVRNSTVSDYGEGLLDKLKAVDSSISNVARNVAGATYHIEHAVVQNSTVLAGLSEAIKQATAGAKR